MVLLGTLLGTLVASLLGNWSVGKRAKGQGRIRAGERTIRMGQDF